MKQRSTTSTKIYGNLVWLKCDRCQQPMKRFSLKAAYNALGYIVRFNCPHCSQLYIEHSWVDWIHRLLSLPLIFVLLALPVLLSEEPDAPMNEIQLIYLLLISIPMLYFYGAIRPLRSLRIKFNSPNDNTD